MMTESGHSPTRRCLLLTATAIMLQACAAAADSAAGDTSAVATSSISASPVQTAERPADACGWIPTADVESIIGKLTGGPRAEGSECIYPLPVDPERARRIAELQQIERQLIAAGATPGFKSPENEETAIIVEVDLTGGVIGERGAGIMAQHFADLSGQRSAPDDIPAPLAGWDHTSSPLGRAGFTGRVGHVRVTVAQQNASVPPALWDTLATRVRDRIPDLPFAYPAPAAPPGTPAPQPDPCTVLTRAEAEAVLGKLTVAPYRTRNESPFADSRGESCAYYTAGHRVLLLTPEWTYGKTALGAARAVENLTSAVVRDAEAEAADTLAGPWDDVAANGSTGELYLLKGNRLIQVGWAMSSTDQRGALRLGVAALQRMAAAP